MAACLLALFPDLSAIEIMDLIRQSGHLYPEHSPEYGFGIPDFYEIYQQKSETETAIVRQAPPGIYPNPFNNVLFLQNTKGYSRLDCFTSGGIRQFSLPLHEKQTEIPSSLLQYLNRGIYFITFTGQEGKIVRKLIKP